MPSSEAHSFVLPSLRHPTLGNFVKRLRKEYLLHSKGLKQMDPDKLRQLNELGFQWSVRRRGPRRPQGTYAIKDDSNQYYENGDDEANSDSSEEEESDDEEEEEVEFEGVEVEDDDEEDDAIAEPTEKAFQMPNYGQKSPGSSNQCAGCYSTILFPSAECGSCRKGYCQDCFDEILHCNEANCSSCRGPVAPTSAGWTHLSFKV